MTTKTDISSNQESNCKELKNIAYKTMLLNGNDINPIYEDVSNNVKITNFLEKDMSANQKVIWSKLDKTQKIIKLEVYIQEILKKNYNLNEEEMKNCKNYLIRCLDRKNLVKTKEVIYDKDSGIIKNIPNLVFEMKTRAFILKKDDKHISTIKSLPNEKKSKVKTIKIYDNLNNN